MKLTRLITFIFVLTATFALFILTVSAYSQKPSPPKSAETTLGGKKISINYSAPSVRGRKIFGGLVPYNQVWRFGANEATSLKTDADLLFGKVVVPKGSYTLFILPSESGWKLIINKQTGQWGTDYNESQDLARIDMKVGKLNAPVEQMTISLSSAGNNGTLKMDWDTTTASVSFNEKK